MSDFDSVFAAAQSLPAQERLRLIDALWASVPVETEAPFSDEWEREIERRVAEVRAGTAKTASWEQIRNEAMGRLRHGQKS